MQPSFEISNIVSSEEVNDLLNYYSSLDTSMDNLKAYTTGFPIEESPFNYISNRLKKDLGDFNVTVTMFLESHKPWNAHTDYVKDDNNPFYAILIPLDHTHETYTVIFNELSYAGTEEHHTAHLPEINTNFTKFERDLLYHIPEEKLKKLSIDKAIKWKTGDAICWRRDVLHCSGYFASSFDKRIALVLFLNRDE